MAIASNSGLTGGSIEWRGITVYPTRKDMLGFYAKHFSADVVLSLYDIWALPADTRRRLPCPWIAWTPVDGSPIPRGMSEQLKTIDYAVAMSKFGQTQIEQAGFESDYIPLGIDCEMFCPGDKDKAKASLGIPLDKYLITTVAANKGYPMRKSWVEILQAFGRFYQSHPEAMLYLHTTREPYGGGGRGIHFGQAIEALGLANVPIMFPDQGELAVGIPDEQMAMIYRASDVLLSPSMGEGFGLPIAEAQACGTPVITQNCSAMKELTINGRAIQPLQPFWVPQLGYWWQQASVERIVDALEKFCECSPPQAVRLLPIESDALHPQSDMFRACLDYTTLCNSVKCTKSGSFHPRRKQGGFWPLTDKLSDEAREFMSGAGVEFVRENYDWSVVIEKYWRPFLAKAERELW